MYKENFVIALKVGGKILREQGDTVAIPFGSEYEIYLKNKSTVRAMVKVEIDGTDVTEGSWLVLNPNSNMDLERFIRNGNWNSGNRFKFIKRTGKIEEHRGIKAEDGLVRIEYKFEKQPDPEVHTHHYHHNQYDWSYYDPYYWPHYYHYPLPSWTTTTTNSDGHWSNASFGSSSLGEQASSGGSGVLRGKGLGLLVHEVCRGHRPYRQCQQLGKPPGEWP